MNTASSFPTPAPANESPLRSIAQSSAYLGVCRAQLYRLIPELDTVKIGNRRMIIRQSLDAFIERSRVPK